MRAFVVDTADLDADIAAAALWGLGVRAIEERAASAPGRVELWTSVGDDDDSIERAVTALGGRWPHRVIELDEIDTHASQRWRDHASPMWVTDDLVVVPAWQQLPDRSAASAAGEHELIEVSIEPGSAFGLGDHPTTMTSLRAVLRLLRGDEGRRDVLDVGCGTGVIAVAAAMFGGRPVRAIDVASAAVEATIDNARRNGVDDLVHVDDTDLAAIDTDYDVVVANILAPALVSLADDLRRVTRTDGRLVISGILAGSHDHVLDALAPMEVVRTDELDGWACVELRHR